MGFKDLPWRIHMLGSVQYLYLATAEKINISFQRIWVEVMSWKTHIPSSKTGHIFGTEHFLFVLFAEGEKMQWGWNADFFLLSLLVNICLKEKWLTESWSPYQLDQFGLGKVHVFLQKCVFAEEMYFWILVVPLNKNSKRIEVKIKLQSSSLIKILYLSLKYILPNARWFVH